ncbi:MAG: lipopolysaccharide heptosyltransferase II [Deltaproteobacteria bacterium]|nr:lipopolysaccharide heptosyltransferase II [Deltaproteobacteria bacterium]
MTGPPARFGPGPVVVRGLNWLGDAVMSLPALAAVLAARPPGGVVVVARAGPADLYRLAAGEKNVIVEGRGLSGRLAAAGAVRELRPSAYLVLPNSFSAAACAFLSRAPLRLGSARNLRSPLLTRPVEFSPEELAAHESFRFLRLAEELGVEARFSRPALTPPGPPPELPLPAGPRLAVAPGAAFGGAKRWPAAGFARAAALVAQDRGGGVVILGGPSETEAAGEVERLLPAGVPVVNLAGRTSLTEAVSVLAGCHLTLANDSGLMHLSAALDVPVVAVFGPTNPVRTSPLAGRLAVLRRSCGCSPCRHRECPKKDRVCFDGLTPELVGMAAAKLLAPARRAPKTVFWSPAPGEVFPEAGPTTAVCRVLASDLEAAGLDPGALPPWVGLLGDRADDRRSWTLLLRRLDVSPAGAYWLGHDKEVVGRARALGGRSLLVTGPRARSELPRMLAAGSLPFMAVPDARRGLELVDSM